MLIEEATGKIITRALVLARDAGLGYTSADHASLPGATIFKSDKGAGSAKMLVEGGHIGIGRVTGPLAIIDPEGRLDDRVIEGAAVSIVDYLR